VIDVTIATKPKSCGCKRRAITAVENKPSRKVTA